MDKKEDWNLELSEYIKQGEPNRVEKTLKKRAKKLIKLQ